MLDKLRIGPKLLLAPVLVLALLIVSSTGAYYAYLRQNQAFETIVQHRAARIRDAADLMAEVQQAHARVYQLLTWLSASFSHARVEALAQDIHARHGAIERRFDALARHTAPGSPERSLLDQSESAHARYLAAVLDVLELSQTDHSMSANAMSKAERAFGAMAQRLAELSRLERELSERASQAAAGDFKTVSTLMPVLVALSIILSLGITMAVRNALLREIRGISDTATDLASGKLTVRQRVYGSDEIAETSRVLDTTIRNLSTTLKDILASAQSIGDASRDIARQANGVPDVSGSIMQMGQITQHNSVLVEEAAAAARNLQQQATNLSRAMAGFRLDEPEPVPPDGGAPKGKAQLRLAAARA